MSNLWLNFHSRVNYPFKLFSHSHSLWCGNILFIKDACLDIHREDICVLFTEAPVTRGGSSYYRSTLRFKACVMTFGKLLNVHGRCLLKVSNAISAHFILSSYFLANSSLPPLSLFLLLLYFSSLSKNLFFYSLWLLYPEALLGMLQMQFRTLAPLFSCPYWCLCVHTTVRRK